MVHRDPQTGKFVSSDQYRDEELEHVHFKAQVSAAAAEMDGVTGEGMGEQQNFEGVELLDYGDIVDRHEVAELVYAGHRAAVFSPSTQTADGFVVGHSEISASPSRFTPGVGAGADTIADQETVGGNGFTLEQTVNLDDNADVIGRVLKSLSGSPFSDGASGVGGAGSVEADEWEGQPIGRWDFDRRDELFWNGAVDASNISDASVHSHVVGYHVYRIREE